MTALKKLWTAFFVAVLLFVLGLVAGTLVNMNDPGCVSCSVNLALTLWFTGVGAHQPVLWVNGLTFRRRLLIWATAFAIGIGTYFGMEALAASLVASGSVRSGVQLGFAANLIGMTIALLASALFVRMNMALTVVLKAAASVALFVALAFIVALLNEQARVISKDTAAAVLIAAYGPALFGVWASARLRARARDRIRAGFSRDWRLIPFYVAAILVSIAALRYIFSD